MKTTKKMLPLLLALCCIVIVAVPAFATDIQPLTEDTTKCVASLFIDLSGQASCSVYANVKSPSNRISICMCLYRVGAADPLKSWILEGTYRLSETKTYFVAKGHDYQVTATITVRDSGGKLIESFPTKSSIVHY